MNSSIFVLFLEFLIGCITLINKKKIVTFDIYITKGENTDKNNDTMISNNN